MSSSDLEMSVSLWNYIAVDGVYDEVTSEIQYPSLTVDVDIPDLQINPPCDDDGRPPTLPDDPLDAPTNPSRPPRITPDKQIPFVGQWHSDPKNIATCGACSEKDTTNYLRHHLVASLDPALTRLLRAGRLEALKSKKYENLYLRKTLSSNQHLKQSANEVYKSEPALGHNFTYRFELEFPELSKVNHLTLFSFSEIDMQGFATDYNLGLSPSLQFTSVPISETVIENSKVKRKATAYRNSKTNAMHNGPSQRNGSTSSDAGHKHKYSVDARGNGTTSEACSPDGVCHSHKIVKGAVRPATGAKGIHKHKIDRLPILAGISTVNAKLNNEIDVKRAKKIHIDLAPRRDTQRIEIKSADKYIPFFGLSCDPPITLPDQTTSNIARFYFDINIEEILKNTEFGGIFDKNLTDCCRERIIDLSKILSLEVRRTKIGDAENRDQVITNDLTELVAYSGDIATDMFSPYEFLEQTREVIIEPKKSGCDSRTSAIGMIKEIFMNYFLGLRTFSGTDYDFPDTGEYEYCVSAKVRNGITLFLNENLSALVDMRKKLQKWYEFSSQGGFVDKHKNRFTKKYKDIVNCDPQGKVDNDKGNNPYLTIVDNAIILFINTYSCVSNMEHISRNELVDLLYSVTNAETGNINGIRILIELYDLLINEMKKTLGSKEFRVQGGLIIKQDTLEQKGITGASKAMKDVIEFQKCFRDLNCPCSNSGTWFDFLGISVADLEGLKEIDPADYANRAAAEERKFIGRDGATTVLGVSTGAEETLELLMSDSSETISKLSAHGGFTSFLSPARIRISDQLYDLTSLQDASYYDGLTKQIRASKRRNGLLRPYPSITKIPAMPFFEGLRETGLPIAGTGNPPVVSSGPQTFFPPSVDSTAATSGPTTFYPPYIDVPDNPVIEAGDILGEDDPFSDYDLGSESADLGCLVDLESNALEELLQECPDPCGEEIRFVYQGLPEPSTTSGSEVVLEPMSLLLSPGVEATPTSTSPKVAMPPHMASLLTSPSVEVQLKTIPELRNMLLFNYDTLVIIEALVYTSTENGTIKNWIPLTDTIVASATLSPVLCRVRKYTERKWGMKECPEFEVSTCDTYFILGDTSKKKKYCNENDKQLENYLVSQQKVYRCVQAGNVRTIEDMHAVNNNQTVRLL